MPDNLVKDKLCSKSTSFTMGASTVAYQLVFFESRCCGAGGIRRRRIPLTRQQDEERDMGYAILRTQKLKSGIAVRRSMTHAFREQDTPNADASRSPDNTHIGAADVDEALAKFNARLPDKVRKNGVLAIEYLVTASPEDMKGKTREQQDDYFRDALKWVEQKHGQANVVYAGIHRDETTPHMYAYVVPIDSKGKLNCRAFLGGAQALSQMQTEFAREVGQQHGLQRGLEGSKARHTSIQQYYARVQEATPRTPSIDLPAAKLLETKETYGRRVAESVIAKIGPELNSLRAKAAHAELAKQETKAAVHARDQAKHLLDQRDNLVKVEREKASKTALVARQLQDVITKGGAPLQELQIALRARLEKDKVKQRDQGRSR